MSAFKRKSDIIDNAKKIKILKFIPLQTYEANDDDDYNDAHLKNLSLSISRINSAPATMDMFLKKLKILSQYNILDFNVPKDLNFTNLEAAKASLYALNPFFEDTIKNQEFPFKNVCVDGVCAVGKTTLLSKLKQNHNIHTIKLDTNITQRNTSCLGSFGYSFSYLEEMARNVGCVTDRTPFNNIDWLSIWSGIVEVFNSPKFNEISNYSECFEFCVKNLEQFLPSSIDSTISTLFHNIAPTIIVIDSNFELNNNRLHDRRGQSDVIRSNWKQYIPLQYCMYILKHKYTNVLLVDLSWFDHDFDLYVDTLCSIIKDTLKNINISKTHILSSSRFEKKIQPLIFKKPTHNPTQTSLLSDVSKFISSVKQEII